MNCFIFPGQGSQKVGTGLDFVANFKQSKEVFEKVSEYSNLDIFSIVNDEKLMNDNAQIVNFTVSIAILEAVKYENKKTINELCSFVAGHSLGEYSALVAAEVLSLQFATTLIVSRAKLMKECCEQNSGSMAAVIENDITKVEKLVELSRLDGKILVCANYNSNSQVVISGHNECIENAILNSKNLEIKRAIKLNVSGAFHSPLMMQANDLLAKEIEKVEFNNPSTNFISSSNANIYNKGDEIKNMLKNQIILPVCWTKTLQKLSEFVKSFHEIGSGEVLCGLVAKTLSTDFKANKISIDNLRI